MILPRPPKDYDLRDQSETRRAIELEDRNNRKLGQDVEINDNRLILKSPDGTRWNITIADDGTISGTSL